MKLATYDKRGFITSTAEIPNGEAFLESFKSTVEMMGWTGAIECPGEVFQNPDKYWVAPSSDGPVLSRRHPMELVLEGMELRGVPDGATVTIEGQKYTADGTDIELSFSHPGTFTVTVSLFPWLDTSVEVVSED